jgi:hypothetical protein
MKDAYHLAGVLGKDCETSKISLGIYGHKPGVLVLKELSHKTGTIGSSVFSAKRLCLTTYLRFHVSLNMNHRRLDTRYPVA